MTKHIPLYVDVDGTLIFTDCLYESYFRLLRKNPFYFFSCFLWYFQGGRSLLKANIAEKVNLDIRVLPYNLPLIKWLKQEKNTGRKLILATASHQKYADGIAAHTGLFDQVIATSKTHNLKGRHKAEYLVSKSGEKNFDYAGDSKADFDVWRHAKTAVVVSSDDAFIQKVQAISTISQSFETITTGFQLRLLHSKRWLMNAVVFLPLLFKNAPLSLLSASLIFIALCFLSSAVSILYDLFNLEEHRHSKKENATFALGQTSLILGIKLVVVLTLCGFVILSSVCLCF